MPVTSKKQKVGTSQGVSFSSTTKEHDDDKIQKPHKQTPKKQPLQKPINNNSNSKNNNKLQFEQINNNNNNSNNNNTTSIKSNSTKLHQCSFSSWLPKAICSINYNNEKNLVAVGREDSSIDIFIKENQELILLKTLGGSKFDFPIISTYWIKLNNEKLALLSVMENKLVMWDVDSYSIIQELNTIGTVKDSSYNFSLNLLAVCTNDSIVRIYNFDGEKIDYQSSFPTITDSKSNVIEWGIDQKSIIVGCTNQIVLFKVDSLRSILNVTTDNIISLKPLNNNTIVCGFINGFVSIIDISFGSIIQDFRNLHAPVRAIQVSKNFEQFYVSGDEGVVVSYNKSNDKWAASGQHKRDSHDIKCLEITSNYLISGGNSTQVIFYDLENFTSLKNGINNYQRFKSYPSVNSISITTTKSSPIFLIEASRHQINLWSLGDSNDNQDSLLDLPNGTPLSITDKTKKLLQFESKSSLNIENIDISNDGNWFSYSTRLETKLYSITNKESGSITIKKIELPNQVSTCSISKFTNDSKYLILAKDLNNIYSFNLQSNQLNNITNNEEKDQDQDNHNNGKISTTIISMEIDSENKILSLINSVNQVYILNIKSTSSSKLYKPIKLPNINSIPTKLYPSNSNSNILYIGTINSIITFDVKQLKVLSVCDLSRAVKFITSNPNNSSELLIWSNNNEQFKFSKDDNSIKKANSSFSDVIFAASQSSTQNDLVIIDLSFFDRVLPSLPEAIKLKKFGGQ